MTDPKQNNRDDLQGKGTQGPQGTESEQTSGEQLTGGEVSDNALSEGGNAPDDSLYAKVYKKRAASGSSDKGGASATPAVEGGEEEVPPLPPRNFDVHSEAELAEALSSQPRDLGTHTEVGQMGTDPSPQADSTYFMEIDPYGSEHSDEEVHGYEVFSEEEENIYEDPDFVGQSQAGSYSSHGMYALASGYSAMDFDSEKWLNVRESVIGGYSVSSDDLVTKGPVYDIRTKILTSDGKLSKFEVEKIVNTLYSNAELVREELCEPLSGNVNDFGNVNCEDVTTLLHIAYRHNVSSKIIGAMRDICGTIPYGVVDAQCKLPIHYAAQNCSPKTVLECYNSTGGGVVDTLDFNGRSFSHYLSANKKCSQELVRQVLDEGSLCCYDKSGKLPVHCFAETATSEVLFSVVESMLSSAQTAALVLSPDGEGRNILHHVVGNPHCTKKDLKQLVKLTSGDVNTQDYYGRTPIMYAAYNKGKLISRLVKCGADINEKDVDGRMVLHHAAISGSRTAIMNVLKQSGLDCAAHDKLGYTALHHASAKSAKVMKALLSLDGVKDEGVKNGMRLALFSEDANGNMPINSACIEGNHKAAENVCLAVMKYYGPEVLESMLIQENKCENTLDLSEFCLMDVLDAGRELYVSAARSELPLSPLHNAIRNCDLKLLKALIDAVPNPGKLLQKQCSAGLTPLQLSVLFGDKDVVKCVARNVPTSQFNDPGGIGITPLNLACLQNRVGLVEALLTNVDIDINQQMGESRNTVLHTAVHRSNAGLVKKVIIQKKY
ncbi:MAG: ankyrin repeat domain-containing protein [Ehrlichia sp.]